MAEYFYLRFNPTLPGIDNRSFRGGGGGASFYFARLLGIKGELMGYASTSFTTTFASSVTLANGATIPAGSCGYIHLPRQHVHLFVRTRGQDPRSEDHPLYHSFCGIAVRRIEHQRVRQPYQVGQCRRRDRFRDWHPASVHHGVWRWVRYFSFPEDFHSTSKFTMC
jgi:hypothetical protein